MSANQTRAIATDLPPKIAAKIRVDQETGCWTWTDKPSSTGYGRLRCDDKIRKAHIVVYELVVGPVPDGLVLDHQCHNRDLACHSGNTCPHRRCVNPAHLEPTTNRENALRGRASPAHNALKTECVRGHGYTPENTRFGAGGKRICLQCESVWNAQAYARVAADPERMAARRRRRRANLLKKTNPDNQSCPLVTTKSL